MQKNPMIAMLRPVVAVVSHALSLMPLTSTQVMPITIRNAGKLKTMGTPSSRGASFSACADSVTAGPSVAGSMPFDTASATSRTAMAADR